MPPLPLANLLGVEPIPQEAKIEVLSDGILLNIFHHCLGATPQIWPTPAWVCQRWRRIVFASPLHPNLRLNRTYGRPKGEPILKNPGCWPALPIIVQYGGYPNLDPPAPEDYEVIVAALKQSGRFSSISLTVTSTLLEKIFTIERPFWQLESLNLMSQDSVALTLPSAFRRGPCLRCLHLTRITFTSLLPLLFSSRNLVDLHLYEVIHPQHVSPEILVNALSGMVHLRSLSLHFLFTVNYIGISPPSKKRVVLPDLTSLNFQGITRYLEYVVARIDAPCLGDIEVTILNEHFSEFSKLSEFINRIEMHKSHHRADILLSERGISISLIQPGASTYIKLQSFFEPLHVRLYFLDQICNHWSAFLSGVEDLCIGATGQSLATWSGRGPWLRPLNPFKSVKRIHVAGSNSTNIVRALHLAESQHENVLPSLHTLLAPEPRPHLREAVVSFMVSRRLSGHPITVYYEPLYRTIEPGGTGTMSAQCHYHLALTGWSRTYFPRGNH